MSEKLATMPHTLPAPRVTKGACETHDDWDYRDDADPDAAAKGIVLGVLLGCLMWAPLLWCVFG